MHPVHHHHHHRYHHLLLHIIIFAARLVICAPWSDKELGQSLNSQLERSETGDDDDHDDDDYDPRELWSFLLYL